MATERRVLVRPVEGPWRGRGKWIARLMMNHPTMAAGLTFLLFASSVAIAAPWIDRHDPRQIAPFKRLQGPSSQHWFGTDQLGRDVYARTVHGSRISLLVGFSVTVTVSVLGIVIGLAAGYERRLDNIVMRFMDGLMAFPSLLLAIALMAILGASVRNVVIAISVVDTPRMVRIVRASTLGLRETTFVEAARALGVSPPRILLRHILPNTVAPVTVQSTFFLPRRCWWRRL